MDLLVKPLQEKMQEYLDSALQLGLLINLQDRLNPQDRSVELYQVAQSKQVLQVPSTVTLGELMPGFVLELRSMWWNKTNCSKFQKLFLRIFRNQIAGT